MIKYYISALVLVWFMTPAGAQEMTGDDAVLPPPEIPRSIQDGEPIEPEVTIIRKQDSVIEEYRVNGNLYMVKVTPSAGPSYYLIDKDGDGRMESRSSQPGGDIVVPQWVLFSWGGGGKSE